jgi:hypothetical protein
MKRQRNEGHKPSCFILKSPQFIQVTDAILFGRDVPVAHGAIARKGIFAVRCGVRLPTRARKYGINRS